MTNWKRSLSGWTGLLGLVCPHVPHAVHRRPHRTACKPLLGHIECGHVTDLPTYLVCRDRCEIEAESVAYVVSAAAGLDASGYTFAYIVGWSGGNVDAVRAAAETVTSAARRIVEQLGTTKGRGRGRGAGRAPGRYPGGLNHPLRGPDRGRAGTVGRLRAVRQVGAA